MAEAFLNLYGEGSMTAESAGLEKGKLNPFVVKVMQEIGIDISQNDTNEVFDFFRQGKGYDAVITVCDAASAESCPVFPGVVRRLDWSFADPSKFTGTDEEILQQTRQVRDHIKESVQVFVDQAKELDYWVTETKATI
jgi:arsenate reductase